MYNILMSAIMLIIIVIWMSFHRLLSRMTIASSIAKREEIREVLKEHMTPTEITDNQKTLDEQIIHLNLMNVIPTIAVASTFPFLWLILPAIENNSLAITCMACAIAYIVMKWLAINEDFQWFFKFEATLKTAAQLAIQQAVKQVVDSIATILELSPEAVEAMKDKQQQEKEASNQKSSQE